MPNGAANPAAGAGDDDYQVIGWLFQAKDEASKVATKLQELIELVTAAVEQHVKDAGEAVEEAVEQATESTKTASGFIRDQLRAVVPAFQKIGTLLASPFVTLKHILFGTEVSLRSLFRAPIRLAAAGARNLDRGLYLLGASAASAAVRAGELVQKLISLDRLGKGLGRVLKFTLGGPLGLLFRLLSPVLNILVDGLLPAFETFMAIVKTAFNPLFELAELLAQMIAPEVVKLLKPIVAFAEILAVQAGAFVVEIIRGLRVGGVMTSLFQSLGPVIMDIFRALGGMASELIPVVFKLFKELAPVAVGIVKVFAKLATDMIPVVTKLFKQLLPIVGKVLKILGTFLADNVETLGKLLTDILPPLIDAFTDLLDAIVPILPPLLKIVTTIIKELFAPAVKTAAKGVATFIRETVVPFIRTSLPILTKALDLFAENIKAVGLVFQKKGFAAGLKEFKARFLDPLAKFLKEWIPKVFSKETLKPVAKAFAEAFIEALGEIAPGFVKRYILRTPGKAFTAPKIPIKGRTRRLGVKGVPGLDPLIPAEQHGGIHLPMPGVGQPIVVGEGRVPEVVMPLTARGVSAVIPPLLKNALDLPGLSDALGVLKEIRSLLGKPLQVEDRMADRRSLDLIDAAPLNGGGIGLAGMGGY